MRQLKFIQQNCFALSFICLILLFPVYVNASEDISVHLLNGKKNIDNGNYDRAITELTIAYEKLPVLGDYALFWRAASFEGKRDISKAIDDIKTIRRKYPDSPLIKNVRMKEIELVSAESGDIDSLFESFVRDYPSEYSVKYAYALHLKKSNRTEEAKKIFKDLYISASSFSKNALNELMPDDITVEDMIMHGKNLNNAWSFVEAEKCFRDALKKANISSKGAELKNQIIEGLAYSLFRQKRYNEASELYKKVNNQYWHARSLLRARAIELFESELPAFKGNGDKRFASILIAYGSMKRREGDVETAIKIFSDIISLYSSEREDALWNMGWTYYLSGNYEKAENIFKQLYETYGDSRYLYWKNKCAEMIGDHRHEGFAKKRDNNIRDFYMFLSILRNSGHEEQMTRADEMQNMDVLHKSQSLPERVVILSEIGLKNEAITELIHLTKKNAGQDMLIAISSYLKRLGSYKMSVNILSKVNYREELRELFYPFAFAQEVEDASMKSGIDPLFIFAVMREESRFDPEARSIAGAMGLLQIMPETAFRLARDAKIKFETPKELYNPSTNILIGSYYLRHLLEEFKSIPVAVAAYNAGENAVREWLKKRKYATVDEFIEDIPYDETRNYVKKVLLSYFEYTRLKNISIASTKRQIGNL